MKTSKFIRRITALALALILTGSFFCSQAFAAEYSDVSNSHWAEEYITKLSAQGYFSGYEDGTFRPSGEITYLETLVLLSRLYSVDETALENMVNDYSATFKEKVSSSLSWSETEICKCLAAGIVSSSELGRLNLSSAINKKDFALLLVRALQLNGTLNIANNATLPFADENLLTGNYRGSVAILYEAGIVDGDENNRFNPAQTVNRAVAAALICRTLEYTAANKITLEIPGYKATTVSSGVITSVNGSVIRVLNTDGICREYTVAAGKYYLNGTAVTPGASDVGAYITVRENDEGVQRADISTATDTEYIYGLVYATATTSYGAVNIVRSGETVNTRYTLAENAIVMLNGKSCAITDIAKNDYAFATVVSGKITELYAASAETVITGTISEINFGSTVELRIADADGRLWYFALPIADLPPITVADYDISIDRLAAGDKLNITVANGYVSKIVSEASQGTVSGQLTSIINNADGLYWEIADTSGTVAKYIVAEDAVVYSGKKAVLLADVKIGDHISATLFNSVITTIDVESSKTELQTGKLTGTVLNVNSSKREIIVLVSDKLYYVNVAASAPVYNAATGKSLGLSQITPDSSIAAYGSFENSTTLSSVLVVIEALA